MKNEKEKSARYFAFFIFHFAFFSGGTALERRLVINCDRLM